MNSLFADGRESNYFDNILCRLVAENLNKR
jgi:hypothetical protein